MARRNRQKETPREAQTLIYVGPALPGLPQYTAFREGRMPANIESLAGQYKHLARLFVPIAQLQEARAGVKEPGHILNYYVQHLKEKE